MKTPDTLHQQEVVPLTPTLPSPEAERRHLTVLFCDLVGSTALTGQLDPEDYREVVCAYHQICAEVLQRFDGYVAQYLGDGVLGYFGYPVAHEDDAQRAVRAGLGLLDAFPPLLTHPALHPGEQVAVRLGVHTGLVVMGDVGAGARHEPLALRETPNIAARLQHLAAPNTLVISTATHQLVAGYFRCKALGAHTLPGLAQPTEVYRVLGASGAQSRLEVAATHGLTPLVGRDQEVGLLLACWTRVTEGMGQVVLLGGEAGIGKSRLVQALVLAGPQKDRVRTFIAGEDTWVSCLAFVARVLWTLGYPDQALTRSHEMLAYAQELSHTYSLSRALFHAAGLHRLRREWSTTQERAEAALAITTEGLGQFMGVLTLARGEALVAQGQGEAGLAQMHQGLAAIRAMGQKLSLSAYLARLAEACGHSGQAEEGLRLLAEALVHVNHTGERYYEAEVYRLKRELLLRQAVPDSPQAEVCFQQALAIAHRQQAKSWELRAATGLSRLWQQQGKRTEAYALLAPVYGWFTEGFDTADLQDARVLLEELA